MKNLIKILFIKVINKFSIGNFLLNLAPTEVVARNRLYSKLFISIARYNEDGREVSKIAYYLVGGRKFIINLNINEFTQAGYYFGKIDNNLVDRIKKGGGIYIDIGSNIGIYSIFASAFFEKVYSFEPSKFTFKIQLNNIELNHIKNIDVINYGLSSVEGNGDLRINKFNNGGNSLENLGAEVSSEIEKVKLTTLDSFFIDKCLDQIDLIKIDIEGHEIEAIKGGCNLLSKFKPLIYCEVASNKEYLAQLIKNLPLGYEAFNAIGMIKISANDESIPFDVYFTIRK